MSPDELAAQVARLLDQVADLEQAVADLQMTRTTTAGITAGTAAPDAGSGQARVCDDLSGFVAQVIAPLYATHLTGGNSAWCPRWLEHDEAVVRLSAVWTAWETLHREPDLGMARWLRDVADPQLDRLRDPDRGPFRACSDGRHLSAPPLPLCPAAETVRLARPTVT